LAGTDSVDGGRVYLFDCSCHLIYANASSARRLVNECHDAQHDATSNLENEGGRGGFRANSPISRIALAVIWTLRVRSVVYILYLNMLV
jgi:hypothetical protein